MDPVTIVGAVASFGQVLNGLIATSDRLSKFVRDFKNTPSDLIRVRAKVELIGDLVKTVETTLSNYPEELRPPFDLMRTIGAAIDQVQSNLCGINGIIDQKPDRDNKDIRQRLAWAHRGKGKAKIAMNELVQTQATLSNVIQLLECRNSMLLAQHIYQASENTRSRKSRTTHSKPSTAVRRHCHVLAVDSLLRSLGFYGHLVFETGEGDWTTRICIGYCAPSWLGYLTGWTASCGIEIANAYNSPRESRIFISPAYFSLQNRAPASHPFMRACHTGDIDLVKQSLENQSGSLNDRTSCTGKTPLLLAIEGNQLEVVRYLLEKGADPAVGDDDQILPVFAVAGLNVRRNRFFLQLPPAWTHWLEVLKLLIAKGASIHEVFHDRPLGTFNIVRNDAESRSLEFLKLLREECYVDFNVSYGRASWSALQTAVSAKSGAVEGLRLLQNWGTDIQTILHDGRTMLHVVAELAIEPGVVTYLLESGCCKYINRQDQWGWTPFHYAVIAEMYGRSPRPFEKVKALLKEGCNIELKARNLPYVCPDDIPSEFTALELVEALKPSISNGLVQVLRNHGRRIPRDLEDLPFQDAEENLTG